MWRIFNRLGKTVHFHGSSSSTRNALPKLIRTRHIGVGLGMTSPFFFWNSSQDDRDKNGDSPIFDQQAENPLPSDARELDDDLQQEDQPLNEDEQLTDIQNQPTLEQLLHQEHEKERQENIQQQIEEFHQQVEQIQDAPVLIDPLTEEDQQQPQQPEQTSTYLSEQQLHTAQQEANYILDTLTEPLQELRHQHEQQDILLEDQLQEQEQLEKEQTEIQLTTTPVPLEQAIDQPQQEPSPSTEDIQQENLPLLPPLNQAVIEQKGAQQIDEKLLNRLNDSVRENLKLRSALTKALEAQKQAETDRAEALRSFQEVQKLYLHQKRELRSSTEDLATLRQQLHDKKQEHAAAIERDRVLEIERSNLIWEACKRKYAEAVRKDETPTIERFMKVKHLEEIANINSRFAAAVESATPMLTKALNLARTLSEEVKERTEKNAKQQKSLVIATFLASYLHHFNTFKDFRSLAVDESNKPLFQTELEDMRLVVSSDPLLSKAYENVVLQSLGKPTIYYTKRSLKDWWQDKVSQSALRQSLVPDKGGITGQLQAIFADYSLRAAHSFNSLLALGHFARGVVAANVHSNGVSSETFAHENRLPVPSSLVETGISSYIGENVLDTRKTLERVDRLVKDERIEDAVILLRDLRVKEKQRHAPLDTPETSAVDVARDWLEAAEFSLALESFSKVVEAHELAILASLPPRRDPESVQ
eukprot:TRINITY_DN8418_c0_g1_i1.p1 TRINITY_DN8418_c0_g1~~TRINITY_DN8418_c0_g1_i1.p1  ORF type:complete len:703 (-),score=201.57 TRINITY_DN8418_c0_g1_i1:85-2193(-)